MTATDRMLVWLREALDAAEVVARAACEGGEGRWQQADPDRMPGFITGDHEGYHVAYDEGYPTLEQATHIALHDPAAVLRRIAADRKILDEHASDGDPKYPQCVRCADTHPGDCECGWHSLGGDHWRTAQTHPCATVRALAEGYGWTEETT